jgi:hypothetical protein
MTVHVRILNGPFFDLKVEALDTVGDFRAAVGAFLQGVAGGEQVRMGDKRIAFQSRQLDKEERTLVSYGVTEGSSVIVYGP